MSVDFDTARCCICGKGKPVHGWVGIDDVLGFTGVPSGPTGTFFYCSFACLEKKHRRQNRKATVAS